MAKIKFPTTENWTQQNESDRLRFTSDASLAGSKNINLDEKGYVKLSPRAIKLIDEADDGTFGVPVGFAKVDTGSFLVGTTADATFNIAISSTALTKTENTGTSNPTMTDDSHTVVFNDLFLASTATAVLSRALSTTASATWTSRITGLTSGKRHYMEVFESKNTLCVTDGNTIKHYNASYADTPTDLTIPADYEAIGLAYNNESMAVITRPASTSTNTNSYFFIWDGVSANANKGYDTGADAVIAVAPYKSSFMILTRKLELLYFNGGGFEKVGQFPAYLTDRVLSTATTNLSFGDIMVQDGDDLLINMSFVFNAFGKRNERHHNRTLAGVWCFNPKIGLYHKYSQSQSTVTLFEVTDANLDISTDIFTVSSGTLPATGNPVIFSNNDSTVPTGISLNEMYFLIKLSATTFKLATTKQNAIDSVAIDITAKGTGGTNSFHIYNIVDFGINYATDPGAVFTIGDTANVYKGVLIGGEVYNTSLVNKDSISYTVPLLENRGYIILPKIYSNEITDVNKNLIVRFRPLETTQDKIVVKARNRDLVGLPITNATNASATDATWTSSTELYATIDLSNAKTHLDAGNDLEIEIISGAGSGCTAQIDSISTDDDLTYSIVLKEEVVGASAGLKCYFVIDNWEQLTIATSDNNLDGYIEAVYGKASKFTQYKLELRGYETTIEDIYFNTITQINTK